MDEITTEPTSKGTDVFLKLLVIGLGVVVGLVAAFIISIFAGWIEFAC